MDWPLPDESFGHANHQKCVAEVFQYLPWQFFAIIAAVGILLAAIACSPTALIHWVEQKLKERSGRITTRS